MARIVIKNKDGKQIKSIQIHYFGYGEENFHNKIKSKFGRLQNLTKEELIDIMNEFEGRIGKKSSGLLLYYAFLNPDTYQFDFWV